MTDGWVPLVPALGTAAQTARELLALARDPGDVRTQRGGAEFLVPPYLAERYTAPVETSTPKRRRVKREGDE